MTNLRGSLEGWIEAGSKPADYDFLIDDDVTHDGKPVALLRSCVAQPGGFGTLMQEIAADDYRGKRLRLSGAVRTADVTGWCGLWMRVDGADRRILAFDNMQSRAIRGTTDWQRHHVVLDVAADAANIAFGVLLHGAGSTWLADVSLDIVGDDVAVTGRPRQPRNLTFTD